jgi:methyl-accepting chemotaxis protein
MADEEVLKLDVDLSDVESAFERMIKAGEEAADRIAKAFGDIGGDAGDALEKLGQAGEDAAERLNASFSGIKGFDEIGQDAEQAGQALQQLGSDGEEAAQQIDQAFADVKLPEIEQEAEKGGQALANLGDKAEHHGATFSHAFEEMGEKLEGFFHKLSPIFGEGAHLMSEFVEKIASSVPNAIKSFENLGEAMAKSGGGMKGLMGSIGELGSALGSIGTVIGTVIASLGALALATAGEGQHLADLRQSIQGTEEDFGRLEAMAHQVGASIDEMVTANNAMRDSFRQSAIALQNIGEMMQLMKDRAKEAAEQQQLLKEKIEAHGDAAKLAAIAEQELALQMERSATMAERMNVRLDRMVRNLRENMPAIARIFGGEELFKAISEKDAEKITKIGDALEQIVHKGGNVGELTREWQALAEAANKAAEQGPEAFAQYQRGMVELFGPHMTQLLISHREEWAKNAKAIEGDTEAINQAMGRMSKEQVEALATLKQTMTTTVELIKDQVGKIGATLAEAGITDLFRSLGNVISRAIGLIGELVSAFSELTFAKPILQGIASLFDALAESIHVASDIIRVMVASIEYLFSLLGKLPFGIGDFFKGLAKDMGEANKKWQELLSKTSEDFHKDVNKGVEEMHKAAMENLGIKEKGEEGDKRKDHAGAGGEGFKKLEQAASEAAAKVRDFKAAMEKGGTDKSAEERAKSAEELKKLEQAMRDAQIKVSAFSQAAQKHAEETLRAAGVMTEMKDGFLVVVGSTQKQADAAKDAATESNKQAEGAAKGAEESKKQGGALENATPKVEAHGAASTKSAEQVAALGTQADNTKGIFASLVDAITSAINAIKAAAASAGSAGNADGGYISGPGSGTSDSILARLSNGEFVMSAAAVQRHGRSFMERLNRFQEGGVVHVPGAALRYADQAEASYDMDADLEKQGYHRSTVTGRLIDAQGHVLSDDQERAIIRRIAAGVRSAAINEWLAAEKRKEDAEKRREEKQQRQQDDEEKHKEEQKQRHYEAVHRELEEEQRRQEEEERRDQERARRLNEREQRRQQEERDRTPAYQVIDNRYSLGGLVDAFALSLPTFSGGGMVDIPSPAPLHPLYLSFNGGGFVGGMTATASAMDQLSRQSVLQQASSTMRSKPSWVK